MPDKAEPYADFVRALRLLHGAINDVRDMMDEDQREQMGWRNLYAAEDLIRALEAATFCPHSLIDVKGTCQMCGREGIELLQSAALIDGFADHSDPETTNNDGPVEGKANIGESAP